LRFEWDSQKAVDNLAKHGVAFEEAATVFRDALSQTGQDPDTRLKKRDSSVFRPTAACLP
jgi:uncharacterized DUF497 family protein